MNRHFTLLAMVFFLWGIITSINSTIILFFSQYFAVSWQQAILVTVIFYVAPFMVCLPCAQLITRLGYRRVLQGALLLSATGSLILAQMVMKSTFLGALFGMFVIASGVSVLQVVVNPYLTALSTPARQVGNLSLASAVNSLGTTLAPAGIALLFRLSPAQQPVSGLFIGLAMVALTLMACTTLFRLPDVRITTHTPSVASLWRVREIWLTILAIFLYVGIEVSLAANLTPYLIASGAWSADTALSLLSFYWGGALVGRLLFGFIAHPSRHSAIFRTVTLSGFALILFAVVLNNAAGGIALLMVGLANSVMYPMIFGHALIRWPTLASLLAGAMVMAGIGGAALPLAQAWLVEATSLRLSFLLPMSLYLLLMLWGEYVMKPEKLTLSALGKGECET
ncbi:MFS transporter [Citrobacter freundii]|uniref:MFS transporter n=1 Tax=Citrobacter TaxID=544 RepID=UPI001650557F|nr:MFS transporter [Citrobacter sp. Cu231]MBC6503296.1 MFS transporter [Citrobacter freundii]MBC6508028.1 MFS transporter [Citrobacter freundii]MDM2745246.1 MFS transporter [Citrobacter sp. Cu231]